MKQIFDPVTKTLDVKRELADERPAEREIRQLKDELNGIHVYLKSKDPVYQRPR